MIITYQKNLNTGYSNYKKDLEYKVPKISNKTDKGKWLNSFVKKFFTGFHNYNYVGKIHLKLKTTNYKMNNDLSVMVAWFKNLKKLKQHHFDGEVFNAQLVYQPIKEAA
tara:strand:+ start:1394 stop:1720 length:327 start_codon:yes stop_codon:yes gene_type:complete